MVKPGKEKKVISYSPGRSLGAINAQWGERKFRTPLFGRSKLQKLATESPDWAMQKSLKWPRIAKLLGSENSDTWGLVANLGEQNSRASLQFRQIQSTICSQASDILWLSS